jgi:hypothetical protein
LGQEDRGGRSEACNRGRRFQASFSIYKPASLPSITRRLLFLAVGQMECCNLSRGGGVGPIRIL